MKCWACSSENTHIIDSRPSNEYPNAVRRRRACQECGHRFTTIEIYELHNLKYQLGKKQVRCENCNHAHKRLKKDDKYAPWGTCRKCGGIMKRNKKGRPKKEVAV
jgi:predicted nucleic acid-binding Zn ribbon protein